jgi:hypothetical protein
MIYDSWWVNAVVFLAICAAVILAPVWMPVVLIAVIGGLIADRLEKRRFNGEWR